jgi:hypothetical protein
MSMIKAAGLSETSVHLLSWLKSGKGIFPFTENVHTGSVSQPASYLNGYRVSLLEVKQLNNKRLLSESSGETTHENTPNTKLHNNGYGPRQHKIIPLQV